MNKKLDELLFEALKPANEPDPDLNRQILDRRSKSNMRKINFKKTAAAAAVAILVVAGGASAYAASQNHSLLSLFTGKSKKNAEDLIDTEVKQSGDVEKNQWASFHIREAICDKNQVWVQVEVVPTDADKYLLVPMTSGPENLVDDLGMDGLSGEQTIGEYAKSLGKECVLVGADIGTAVQTQYHHMEENGTLVFTMEFKNEKKDAKLEYVCVTQLLPAGKEDVEDVQEGKIRFALNDDTKIEEKKYIPASGEKVPGTDLVMDGVTFSVSELGILCEVKYHYAGDSKEWYNTKENDICFFMLDADGKIAKSGGGGSTEDGVNVVQTWQYSLQDLPDTITFQAKDVMENKMYGTVEVKLAE